MNEASAAIALSQVYVYLIQLSPQHKTEKHHIVLKVVNDAIADLTGNSPPWVAEYHQQIAQRGEQ